MASSAGTHPKVFGRYRVLCHLAEGGMGTVYLAQDPNLSRVVAIKVIHADHLDRSSARRKVLLERFAQEAAVLARLRSPSIVEVYDFDTEGGSPYLVMEFVDGQTLEGLFRQLHGRPLDPQVTVCLLVQVAEGLCAAEKMGVVHRDLKPANLLLHQDGVLKIADFGIAQWADHSTTRTGVVLGSQLYMSPEQAEGKRLTVQSDMFALGTVAYQAITGEVPFPGDSQPSVARKICYEPHVPLVVRRPDLDPTLVHVVETLLQKEPERRGGGPRWVRSVLLGLLHNHGVLDPQERIRRYVHELSAEGLQTTGSFDRTRIRRIEAELKQAESRPRSPVLPVRPHRGLMALSAGGAALAALLGAGIWVYSTRLARPASAPKAPSEAPTALIPKAFPESVVIDAAPTPAEPLWKAKKPPTTAPMAPRPTKPSRVPARQPVASRVQSDSPPPAPMEAGEVYLSIISSPPFAEVFLDGDYLSTAPVRDRRIRSGRYRVRLEWKNAEMGVLDTILAIQPGRHHYRFVLPGFRETP